MSAPTGEKSAPIESREQLTAYLESGCKPLKDWRIGTEHEKFAYDAVSFRRLAYDGSPGIRELLAALSGPDWRPVYEQDHIIALDGTNGGSITLEPGGQLELSGAPLRSIHETCSEVHTHLDQLRRAGARIGAGVVGLGFDPQWALADVGWMPKGRYRIMRAYMQTKGSLGLDMMGRTCTVQVNLDFSSEADMVRKMRVGLALQPLATALFANSPFCEGRPNGFLSYRSHCWTDTDPDRCGMLPFVFEDGFGFARWVEYILDVPMYFIHRGDAYIDVSGRSFRDFMAGRLPGHEGELPTFADWEDHLTTAFPEVRLKKFIEMRGADGGPWGNLCALPAFWVGLLYDSQALNEAEALIRDWTVAEITALRAAVPKTALKTPFRGASLREIAREVLAIARGGLGRRRAINPISGRDEQHYIDPLHSIVESGTTYAEDLLADYDNRWGRRIDPIYAECHY